MTFARALRWVHIQHPNIVKLLGIHHDNGTYSLIQEFIQGTNLFDFMHKFNMKIPISRQLLISVQVCDAMTYLHEMRILHRDLKSQNVIYQEAAGICKLCDFGLARLMPPGLYELDPAQLGTGGTPAYQGPEVLKRQNIGFRVDLYGFGIMIWEMYTSKLPWSDCTLEQMTHKVSHVWGGVMRASGRAIKASIDRLGRQHVTNTDIIASGGHRKRAPAVTERHASRVLQADAGLHLHTQRH